jgi:uncharacterized membrane protein
MRVEPNGAGIRDWIQIKYLAGPHVLQVVSILNIGHGLLDLQVREIDAMSDIISITHNSSGAQPFQRLAYQLTRYWIVLFAAAMGIYVGLPFLAPVFMHWGWSSAGKTIYLIYSFLCHQLPERSYFLFGPKVSYSLGEIQSAWQNSLNPMILRQFIGNPDMGWKVAWSDRMISMYASTLVFGLLWYPFRRRLKVLPWWGFLLFLLPMVLDGGTHFLSDLSGIGQGFRYTNKWLATLIHQSLPLSFYVGDALGSFNSWMRLLTGVLFGIGVVWFGFPYIDRIFADQARNLRRIIQPGDPTEYPVSNL